MCKTHETDGNMDQTTKTPTHTDNTLEDLLHGAIEPDALPVDTLAACLAALNDSYRRGAPRVSDTIYDRWYCTLARLAPDHPYLAHVEPETTLPGSQITRHAYPMLSLAKAYSRDDLALFCARCQKTAAQTGHRGTLRFRVTAKLDGMSGRDQGGILATRSTDQYGADITQAFDKGLAAPYGRDQGDGEIVVAQSYFNAVLRPAGVRHPRNFVVGFVAAETLSDLHREATAASAIRFIPYRHLPAWEGSAQDLLRDLEQIEADLRGGSEYLTDGIVVELADEEIRAAMGSTSHHHHWNIAYKTNREPVPVRVRAIHWATGRTGRITPKVEFDPVDLEGAITRYATAHTSAQVLQKGLGIGAEIGIVRGGDVIPWIADVIKPAAIPATCTACPSCGGPVAQDGAYLTCIADTACPAQVVRRLVHFFKTLRVVDGFGPSTLETITAHGITQLEPLLSLSRNELERMGFGPQESANLAQALQDLPAIQVDDARWLAAFGIRHLGRGDSRHLLQVIPLDQITHMTPADLARIPGFGDKTAVAIVEQIQAIAPMIDRLRVRWSLRRTPLATEATASPEATPIAGRRLVFTGTFAGRDREHLEAEARALGATVQSAVNKQTTWLVVGENPGASKCAAAARHQVPTLDQDAYDTMLCRNNLGHENHGS